MALNAGKHQLRMAACTLRIRTLFTGSTGIRRKCISLQFMLLQMLFNQVCHLFMLHLCLQRFLQVHHILNLRDTGEEQNILVLPAALGTFLHRSHSRRAGPGSPIAGTFLLADCAYPVIVFNLFRFQKLILIDRKLCNKGFDFIFCHKNSFLLQTTLEIFICEFFYQTFPAVPFPIND